MGRWQIGFEYPWFLLLLAVLPVVWWIGNRSLAGLGKWRQWIAVTCRTLVILLVVFALAGIQWIWISDRVTVMYVLDQSDSIPAAKRQMMLKYAVESVNSHRRQKREDRAGLIIFGREASIEFPPIDDKLPPISRPESYFGKTDATNLESALKLAQASFPEDSARRVVLLTDGNETLGTSEAIAKNLTDAGVGIDIVPIRLDSNAEILVEKVDVPGNVRQGQPVDAKVVIHRYTENGENTPIEGLLRVNRRVGNQEQLLFEDKIVLDRDVNVVAIPDKIEQPAGYIYEATFTPSEKANDAISQNNSATAFAYAHGKGRVLLIEDANNKGNYDMLVEALGRNDIEVAIRDTTQLFSSLIELQGYDSVILAGIPRTTGEAAGTMSSFTDEQIEMLVTNTQQFGAGILMLGGAEAFGAGGWSNTKLEEAMPVDFQIKNDKIEAVGALAMVMHASEIAQGNYWQKMIARSALDVLGPMDYCGVVQFDMLGDRWMWGGNNGMLRVGPNKRVMRGLISNMSPGDMPDFDPAMQLALASLKNVPASTKHMIVISDGDPSPTSAGVLNGFTNAQIKVSTVAVGGHGPAGHAELQRIATATGGNYYVVTNPSTLPKIFIREARRVAKPLVFEPEGGIEPQMLFRHEVLQGVSETIPKLRGFVLTQVKDSSLVEVPLLSPAPAEKENATLLATWTYGLGRTAVLTTDSGHRWASDWVDWTDYDRFFSQLVRWTMRPTEEEGKYQLATRFTDGKVQIIVNALDKEDRFLNFLNMSAVGVSPDLQPFPITMRQHAPGRYIGEFPADVSGSYMVSVTPAPGQAPLTTGVTVPYSEEYRIRQANLSMLGQLAGMKAVGGGVGTMSDALEESNYQDVLALDTFRSGLAPARSLQDIWPWAVLLGATLFFADVFVRRVAIDLGIPIRYLASRLRPREDATATERQQRMERLRIQKSEVSDAIDKRRAETQFDPMMDREVDPNAASNFGTEFKGASIDSTSNSNQQASMSADDPENSYTSRLLKAKRDAKKNQ